MITVSDKDVIILLKNPSHVRTEFKDEFVNGKSLHIQRIVLVLEISHDDIIECLNFVRKIIFSKGISTGNFTLVFSVYFNNRRLLTGHF